jgi:hypothetical protein
VDKSAGNYLHLRLQADAPAICTVSYGRGSTGSFTFKIKPAPAAADYLVRLSTQWAWASQDIPDLRVACNAPARAEAARLLSGD